MAVVSPGSSSLLSQSVSLSLIFSRSSAPFLSSSPSESELFGVSGPCSASLRFFRGIVELPVVVVVVVVVVEVPRFPEEVKVVELDVVLPLVLVRLQQLPHRVRT